MNIATFSNVLILTPSDFSYANSPLCSLLYGMVCGSPVLCNNYLSYGIVLDFTRDHNIFICVTHRDWDLAKVRQECPRGLEIWRSESYFYYYIQKFRGQLHGEGASLRYQLSDQIYCIRELDRIKSLGLRALAQSLKNSLEHIGIKTDRGGFGQRDLTINRINHIKNNFRCLPEED